MPNWNETLNEVQRLGSPYDVLRRKYLDALFKITQRNIIAYYSGWLQKPGAPSVIICDDDKNGFMSTINQLDCSLGLDLILHTPGGEIAATESLVDYLRQKFGTNIRAFVPQLAMSGGTLMACACSEIWMGKQSSLGPVDPQIQGIPAHGVLEEFVSAHREIKNDPSMIPVWQPVIAKYPPAFVGECQKAIAWSMRLLGEWLESGMLAGDANRATKITRITKELADHALTLSHARHLSAAKCRDFGLVVKMLEDVQPLQDAVLSLHHAFMLTMSHTPAVKIIENHRGVAFVQSARPPAVPNSGLQVQ